MADAADLKAKADALFRSRSFTDAIAAYTRAIACAPENHALFSNRAACREKLLGSAHGGAKADLVNDGLNDCRQCVALDPSFAKGFVRLAAFLHRAAQLTMLDRYDYADYHVNADDRRESKIDGGILRGGSAKALAACIGQLRECEAACRTGLGLDQASEPLRVTLQKLRDEGPAAFALDPSLAPDDAALSDPAAAQAAKASGGAKFAAKDFAGAEACFTSALGWDPLEPVLWSNRSACRAAQHLYGDALVDADACCELKPGWSRAHGRRATALFGVGDYEAAEAAAVKGLECEADNKALAELLETCRKETREPLAVQKQMATMRAQQRSQAQMSNLLKGLGGGSGGPQVFNMQNFDFSGGGGNLFGGNKPKMSEEQMRSLARAMASGGPTHEAPAEAEGTEAQDCKADREAPTSEAAPPPPATTPPAAKPPSVPPSTADKKATRPAAQPLGDGGESDGEDDEGGIVADE